VPGATPATKSPWPSANSRRRATGLGVASFIPVTTPTSCNCSSELHRQVFGIRDITQELHSQAGVIPDTIRHVMLAAGSFHRGSLPPGVYIATRSRSVVSHRKQANSALSLSRASNTRESFRKRRCNTPNRTTRLPCTNQTSAPKTAFPPAPRTPSTKASWSPWPHSPQSSSSSSARWSSATKQ